MALSFLPILLTMLHIIFSLTSKLSIKKDARASLMALIVFTSLLLIKQSPYKYYMKIFSSFQSFKIDIA